MKNDDSELIQRTLDGDQQAFAQLVEKYQEQVHTLAWQKIGDFHIAQEITQDVFITAYQKFATFTHYRQFAGWLYVVTNRKYIAWHRKHKIETQSIDETNPIELEEAYYTEYMTQQREEETKEKRRTIVHKLLSKLKESDRTVMSLYYLAEMPCEDIGKFLGISPNTVRSRLHRARNQLREEEAMIKDSLSSFQLPAQMTENIMKEISRLNPVTPSGSKPLVPLAISAASAVLVLLLMGLGTQRLSDFQKLYNLNAQSERTIEISEAQIVIDSPTKPAVRNQIGRADLIGESNGVGQTPDDPLFAAANADETDISKAKPQWVQTKGPEGGTVPILFTSTKGDVYAGTQHGLYRLTDDGTAWKFVNTLKGPKHTSLYHQLMWWPIAENKDTLYLANDTDILASSDRGETWNVIAKREEGRLVGIVITESLSEKQDEIGIILALTNGIFRSDDRGKTWTNLTEGFAKTEINAITSVGNTIFAGTNKGLYRLNSDNWEKISLGESEKQGKINNDIYSLSVSENRIYVVTKIEPVVKTKFVNENVDEIENIDKTIMIEAIGNKWSLCSIYHSDDQGESWNEITPELNTSGRGIRRQNPFSITYAISNIKISEDQYLFKGTPYITAYNSTVKLATSGKNVLVVYDKEHLYSNDAGKTWTKFDVSVDLGPALATVSIDQPVDLSPSSAIAMLNANTFYRSGPYGIHRTTNSGKSWHPLNNGLVNTNIEDIVVVKGTIYANTGNGLLFSTDKGESWSPVPGDTGNLTSIFEYNDKLYARDDGKGEPLIYRLSSEENKLTYIPDIPSIKIGNLYKESRSPIVQRGKGFFLLSLIGSFIVSENTYFVEYKGKLFRWKLGTLNWYDTGVVGTGESHRNVGTVKLSEMTISANTDETFHKDVNININITDTSDLTVAVSGNFVYVGKRDGKLMYSSDQGDRWEDITETLPFTVEHFHAIIFVGKTVYAATDKGIIKSSNGNKWQTMTDTEDKPLIVDRFAADKSKVYAQSNQRVYQLIVSTGTWQQVSPEITQEISTFDVDGNTIYIGTSGQGVFTFTLDNHNINKTLNQ